MLVIWPSGTSQEVNGVSKLHGEVSQKMFAILNPDYQYNESHIGYVTNSAFSPSGSRRMDGLLQ
ncbi:MAG: hypothetical protein R2778_00620 [Saprospiraceae bacterium]